jgi:CTP:molybdopterin cytidylyltransferase MocA
MNKIDVDTGGLSAEGSRVLGLGTSLGTARAALLRVQGAGYEAASPEVAAAVEQLVAGWGTTIVALQEAAEGLSRNAIAAAAAYDATDTTVIGGGD